MAATATGNAVRQAVDLDNLIQEYVHFEKVKLNAEGPHIEAFCALWSARVYNKLMFSVG